MSTDLVNNEFYNEYAGDFDKIPFEEVLKKLIASHLSKSSCNILEIGSGPGALALWMTTLGHNLTCVEPAAKPAEKARQKGLNVSQMRFQDFPVSQKFDAIIAISSLIHIARSEMPSQVLKMSQLLNPQGVAIVSFIEGNDEGYEDPTGMRKQRFFSKFTHDELNAMLLPHFSITEIHRIEGKKIKQTFLLMVLKPL